MRSRLKARSAVLFYNLECLACIITGDLDDHFIGLGVMLPAPGGECLPLPSGFVGMTGSFRFSQAPC
jgi:hypothetical protein